MDEYISKGNALFAVSALPLTLDAETTQRAIEAVRAVPAADVRPVVHGYNKDGKYSSLFACSVCGWECWDTVPGDTEEYNFCPNCGAKIDQEESHE